MKKSNALLFGFVLFGLTTGLAADDLPEAEKFSRYEAMLKRSPFAVATAAAPIVGAPDFAKELYVANAGHSDTGDFVTIASTTNRELKLYLSTKEAVDGYSIPNIQWSDRVGETKVTIEKGGQVATLGFNEAVLGQPIQNQVSQISRPQPGIPNLQGVPGSPLAGRSAVNLPMPLPRPMNVPTIPTPPPHTRSLIRRNLDGANRFPRPQQVPRSPEDDDEPNP